jgi:hypothetical protein
MGGRAAAAFKLADERLPPPRRRYLWASRLTPCEAVLPTLGSFHHIKVSVSLRESHLVLTLDISLLSMVQISVEYRWEFCLDFDLAHNDTLGSLKARIKESTGIPIGTNLKRTSF